MVDDNRSGTEEENETPLQSFITGLEEAAEVEARGAKVDVFVRAVAQGFQHSTFRLDGIEEVIDHLQDVNETDIQVLRETLEAMDVQIVAMRRALEDIRGSLLIDRKRAAPGLPDIFPI